MMVRGRVEQMCVFAFGVCECRNPGLMVLGCHPHLSSIRSEVSFDCQSLRQYYGCLDFRRDYEGANCCDVLMLVCDYSLGVVAVAAFGLIGVVVLPEPLLVGSGIERDTFISIGSNLET